MSAIGEHLGGGVVIYRNAFSLDWEWMREFCHSTLLEERNAMYLPGIDPITGEDGYINKSNYFFKKDSIEVMPWRGSLIHQNGDTKVQETIDYLEEAKDKCLQDYLHKFPLAGKCIWWRIRGHVVAYPKGSFLGLHADIQTEYEFPQFNLGCHQLLDEPRAVLVGELKQQCRKQSIIRQLIRQA